jgi:hypothetical protein
LVGLIIERLVAPIIGKGLHDVKPDGAASLLGGGGQWPNMAETV